MVSKRGCVGWLRKRSNLEKTLLSVSSLLLLTLLLVILVGVAFRAQKPSSPLDDDGICWTSECIRTAGEMLSATNPESDSCTHFYDFACGRYGFHPGQSSSAPKRSRDLVNSLLRKILESKEKLPVNGLEDLRSFYETCVQFGSHRLKKDPESLKALMRAVGLGDWPTIDSYYDLSDWSANRTLAKLILLGIPVAFRMDIVPDKYTGMYLIRISPGGPRESGRSPDDIRGDVQLRSSILTSVLGIAQSTAITTDVSDILSVDAEFAASEQVRNASCDTILLSPQEVNSELQRLVYNVDWSIVLSEIRNATGIVRPFAVQVNCRQEIRDYMDHLYHLTDRSAANYLGWRFFSTFVDHVIPTSMMQSSDEELPRLGVCLDLLTKMANPPLAKAFTRKMISDELEAEAENIFMKVVHTTEKLISQATWLSPSQRSNFNKKVFWFIDKFPFKSSSYGGEMTVNIPRVNVSNFTAAVVHNQRQRVIQRFQKLFEEGSTESEIDKYFLIPDDFSAILPPFLSPDVPHWINYGGFGVFVARQIMNFLLATDTGTSDGPSILEIWLKADRYQGCLYNQETQPLSNSERKNMLRELFLDRSSVEIAFESAKSESRSGSLPGLDVSPEKMFFLAYAQTLCDVRPRYSTDVRNRVDSTISSFREVFGCESPPVQCRIWD